MRSVIWKSVIDRVIRSGMIVTVAIVLFISISSVSFAQEAAPESRKELVIVTDCSQSMQDADKEYIVFDFIKSLYAVLPRDYQIGIVAFNNEICAEVPLGSSYSDAAECLQELSYNQYGNAGAGLAAAVAMFGPDASDRRILLISDGEIMMKAPEDTQAAALQFEQAAKAAQDKGILIDVVALGPRIEEGAVVYPAADITGGRLYELPDGDALGNFAESLLFEQWRLNAVHVGQIGGMDGELSVRMPDCLMSKARIVLLGSQQNENMTLNCEADRVYVSKGINYTVIDLFRPASDEVKIQMSADSPMDVRAYLTAEYDFTLNVDYTYVPEEQTADFRLELTNENGQNMLEGHLKDNGLGIYLDGEEQICQIIDGVLCISKEYKHDASVEFRVVFNSPYGNYYGNTEEAVEVIVPTVEKEQPAVDWFFWLTLLGFAIALSVLFLAAYIRSRKANEVQGKIDILETKTAKQEKEQAAADKEQAEQEKKEQAEKEAQEKKEQEEKEAQEKKEQAEKEAQEKAIRDREELERLVREEVERQKKEEEKNNSSVSGNSINGG